MIGYDLLSICKKLGQKLNKYRQKSLQWNSPEDDVKVHFGLKPMHPLKIVIFTSRWWGEMFTGKLTGSLVCWESQVIRNFYDCPSQSSVTGIQTFQNSVKPLVFFFGNYTCTSRSHLPYQPKTLHLTPHT